MKIFNRIAFALLPWLFAASAALFATGCQSQTAQGNGPSQPTHAPQTKLPTIRINAGASDPVTDSKGILWAPDSGFAGGDIVDRPDLSITGTSTPEIYRTEHYSMDSLSVAVPNGKYILKLHFSEDYEGITSPGERRFTYTVRDGSPTGNTIKEVKHFSPWEASGAQFKAYIDSIPVTVTAGQITITFVPEIENPQINALEIIPQ